MTMRPGREGSRLRAIAALFGARHLDHEARHLVLFLAVGAALSLAAAVGVAWAAGLEDVAARFRHPNLFWLPLALAGAVATHVGYVLAYREVASVDEGLELGLPRTGALVASGFGVFMPRGGFALDLEALRVLGVPRSEARARVLGLGSLEYAVLGAAACVCSLLLLLRGADVQRALLLSWAIGVPTGSLLALAALRLRGALCRGRLGCLLRPGLDALVVVGKILGSPRRHGAAAIAVMSLYWAGETFLLWACLAAFTRRAPSIPAVVVGYATGYALTRRTLPLAGAGAVEALLPFSLSWVGFPVAPAVLAVFVYRVLDVWLPLGPALAGLVALRRGLATDAEVGGHDGDVAPLEGAGCGRRAHR